MSLAIALQMDPPGSINPASDSTMLLALEAQRRGHTLFYYGAPELSLTKGEVRAPLRPIAFRDQLTDWFTMEAPSLTPLSGMDVVLMRQDPPFDMGYITATYLLEQVTEHTFVTNHPASVRNHPEKLFPLEFRDFTPPTLLGTTPADILPFLEHHRKIVLKPLYGFGGHGVFVLEQDGPNLHALLESFSVSGEPFVVQMFLPEISDGDRRALFIDGQMVAMFARLPAKGDIRANMRVGGTPAPAAATPRQHACCEAIGAVLKERGILLAGVDFIGDYLIEVNITCPTGLRAANKLYGLQLEKTFWDALEAQL